MSKKFSIKIKIQSDFLKWFYNILNYKYNKIFKKIKINYN